MFRSTLSALATRRRALPIGLVAAGLLTVETLLGVEPLGPGVVLLMVAGFVLVGPASWRSFHHANGSIAHLVAYGSTGLGVVGVTGFVVPWTTGMGPTILTDAAGLPLSVVLFWVGGWGLGRDIELERSLVAERARRDEAQLLAMRAHLDPHFLFNTLNAIAEWCREDPAQAEEATLRLAAMLRVMLDGITEDRWSLTRELDLVDDLWALHRVRDPERVRYAVEADGIDDVDLPPLLLLPLAENAMTHGVWGGGRGEVRLAVERDGPAIHIRIESPGAFGGERKGGHGLATVRERLTLAYGPAARLEIGPQPDDVTRTRALIAFPAVGSDP